MALISVKRNWISGNRFHILLLEDLVSRYKEETGCRSRMLYLYPEDHPWGDPLADLTEIHVVPVDEWPYFKKWCAEEGMIVHLKRKEIDQQKTWWPCVIELIIEDTGNENLVLLKLKHLY